MPALALRAPDRTSDVIRDLRERRDDKVPEYVRIRCPHCGWQPGAADRWHCGPQGEPEHYDGCGTSWNTFRTRGRCPGCDHQWRWTACLSCTAWARHEEWYVTEGE